MSPGSAGNFSQLLPYLKSLVVHMHGSQKIPSVAMGLQSQRDSLVQVVVDLHLKG